ncbi:hypothetical protein GEU84_015725 [Fertoebacter nigrum]|uniref:Uncharacterized protein n=1 Tax=Fertoeibacter niger TaxID=2656921 RepID=A0A8X8KS01_9RHOB|nr:hypothetical protein [Fertoeibacter niger]NUB45847.1 hypothetical protein [Fertoeibacter niger]
MKWMRKPGEHAPAVAALRALLRNHFALGDAAVIVVAQLNCQVPGCPPVETLATFWDAAGERHRLRFFVPVADVTPADLPPRWYLPALRDDGIEDCSCCG